MTQQALTVEQGNELIAGFMGCTVLHNGAVHACIIHKEGGYRFPDGTTGREDLSELKYHTSWDWLMPACKKWDNFDMPDKFFDEYERRTKLLATVVTQTWDCKEAFTILAEAIQWYNENTQTDNSKTK